MVVADARGITDLLASPPQGWRRQLSNRAAVEWPYPDNRRPIRFGKVGYNVRTVEIQAALGAVVGSLAANEQLAAFATAKRS